MLIVLTENYIATSEQVFKLLSINFLSIYGFVCGNFLEGLMYGDQMKFPHSVKCHLEPSDSLLPINGSINLPLNLNLIIFQSELSKIYAWNQKFTSKFLSFHEFFKNSSSESSPQLFRLPRGLKPPLYKHETWLFKKFHWPKNMHLMGVNYFNFSFLLRFIFNQNN